MTDVKKTAKSKNAEKSKKLRLNKETLTDLSGNKVDQVKGGGGALRCTREDSGCGPV